MKILYAHFNFHIKKKVSNFDGIIRYVFQPNDESYYNSFGIKTKFRFEKINEQKCYIDTLENCVR